MTTCNCHGHHQDATGRPPGAAGQTVSEIASRSPRTLEVLQRFGINHCCGAGLTLAEAAASAGADLQALLAALDEAA